MYPLWSSFADEGIIDVVFDSGVAKRFGAHSRLSVKASTRVNGGQRCEQGFTLSCWL